MCKHSKILFSLLTVALICSAAESTTHISATSTGAEKTTEVTTTTTTVITKTIVKEKSQWSPFRVCVLDFSSLDIEGQKRFLNEWNKPIVIPPQCTLNDADRQSINSVMQGFIRMIDAWDNTRTNQSNRDAQVEDNSFDRNKALSLYDTIVGGEARPMVIGAEYLSAYLGRHNDVFSCLVPSHVTAVMQKLQQAPDFPKDFMLRLARETGATHLIYGTVSDMRTKTNSFKGYGIETKTTTYQLDVIIKLVDLAAQHTVYSNVYTGNYREQRHAAVSELDNNIFQNLMTATLEQAAEELYNICKPGSGNRVTVTPLPFTVTIIPDGEVPFNAASAEVFIDGTKVGNGQCTFLIPPGEHEVLVKADGYKARTTKINVKSDTTVTIKLEK